MLRRLTSFFFLALSPFLAYCSHGELEAVDHCDCVCSDERVPDCRRPQEDDCPPSPICASDLDCEAYCQSDELCGESEPKFVSCHLDLPGQTEELFCRQIPQCDGLSVEDCVERFTPFDCTFEWLFYRLCVSEEGCDTARCRSYLEGWESCKAAE